MEEFSPLSTGAFKNALLGISLPPQRACKMRRGLSNCFVTKHCDTCTTSATTATAMQYHQAPATGLSSEKRHTIPLKGGGLLLLEPGVVSLPVCLWERQLVQSCDGSLNEVSVSVFVSALLVFVCRHGWERAKTSAEVAKQRNILPHIRLRSPHPPAGHIRYRSIRKHLEPTPNPPI